MGRIKDRYEELKKLSKEKGGLESSDFNKKEKSLFIVLIGFELIAISILGIIAFLMFLLMLLIYISKGFI